MAKTIQCADGLEKVTPALNMAFLVSMLNFCGIHESLTVCLMDPSFCSNLIINLYHFSGSNTPSSDMGIGAFFSVDASRYQRSLTGGITLVPKW